jgi:hypothetical protein
VNEGEGFNFYTVTLNNRDLGNGATGGAITYSPVMCGDCLIELDLCGHGHDLRREKKKGKRK